uniref:Recombinase n=1 Tax=Endocarpon pusillum TaxID=364733 RepID=F8QX51_9EURO|nr:recombinase [Endocarpon pusillum]
MNRHRRPPAAPVARRFTVSLVVSAKPQLDNQRRREKSRFTTTTSQARNPGVRITLQTTGGDEVIYRD